MKYLVIDHIIQVFLKDRILDPGFAAQFPGATVLSCLTSQARKRGWEVHTADVFLEKVSSFEKAVCISNEFTPLFKHLMEKGVIPGLLISGESPNVARNFYRDLPVKSKPFKHACLFRGCISRLDSNCEGHTFQWPCPTRVLEMFKPWEQRALLGMVASYKHAWGGLRTLPKEFCSRLSWQVQQFIEPTLRLHDLYPLRIKLARLYGPKKEFLLNGHGWPEIISREHWGCHRSYKFTNSPISCVDKLSTLGECLFSLILENCIYPGYVTEKIFDAFRAGTVPVYLGAPDIEDFVPSSCFIDYRWFKNPNMLWKELINMSETQWNNYQQAITTFLRSSQYQQHLEEKVAQQWLTWIEEV